MERVPRFSAATLPSASGAAASIKPGIIGKHRLTAAISHFNQQIQFIQEELAELDTVDSVNTVCEELVSSMDKLPDPLLPVTRGPADAAWDKWFQGAKTPRRKRWI